MPGLRVALAGATGAVGREFLDLLDHPDVRLDIGELVPIASQRSVNAGITVRFRDEDLPVRPLRDETFEGCDLAFFSAGGETSREWAPRATKRGCVVVDNSSAFRMDPEVPLVVPEVNPDAAQVHRGIIANPNCSTAIFLVGVAPLHRAATLTRAVVCTYQAVSGAGARAMAELDAQVAAEARGEPLRVEVFPKPIAHNVLPHVDRFLETGFTREEMKLVHESYKILGVAPESLAITGTCVRVPVRRSHAEACHLAFAEPLSVAQAREAIAAAPGVRVLDDPSANVYPTPREIAGEWAVAVGRLRADPAMGEHGLACWIVGDQLLKGAALNAVQIAELLFAG